MDVLFLERTGRHHAADSPDTLKTPEGFPLGCLGLNLPAAVSNVAWVGESKSAKGQIRLIPAHELEHGRFLQ